MKTTAEMMDDILQKYYPDGLVWEVKGTHLTVHWGKRI